MDNKIFLVIDESDYNGYIEKYNNIEAANTQAENLWDHLTKSDKKNNRKIYVICLLEEHYNLVNNGDTQKYYNDYAIESKKLFNSEELK